MSCFAHPVARTRGRGSAAVSAVLLAVLALVLGVSAPGSEHPRASTGTAAAAEAASSYGASDPDRAGPAVPTTSVRSHRDGAGERHAPPGSTPGASPGASAPSTRPAPPRAPAADHPDTGRPAHRHGVRAPPRSPATDPSPLPPS